MPPKRVITIAEPVGVIAGLVPVTNPTSTVLFKALIAAKTRNAIVFAPHPRAVRSSGESARVMQEAAQEAGAPADLIQSMSRVSVAGTDALMRHHRTDLVLATGSRAMVLAAYSSGKPTYAVGPGNVPAYIHASVRDIDYAARCIMAAKIFDWGTACASEQSAIVDRSVAARAAGRDGARGRAVPERRPAEPAHDAAVPAGRPRPLERRGRLAVARDARAPGRLHDPREHAAARRAPGRHRLRLPALARDPRAGLQVHRGRGPRRGHRDRGRPAALRRRRPHRRRARPRRGRHLALRRGGARLPRARQHAVAVRRHGLLDRSRPHLHDRHRHDRRLDLVRQHRRAAPDQPQARGRADPRLGDAAERPRRPARRALGAQPRARRRRDHRAGPPARRRALPRPLRPHACRQPPRRPRRPSARASRTSSARRSQR